MPIALDSKAIREYQLKDDTTGTIFLIGILDSFTKSYLDGLLDKIRNKYAMPFRMIKEQLEDKKLKDEKIRTALKLQLVQAMENFEAEQKKINPDDEARYFFNLFRLGLRGWKNFRDADGKDIPFETEDFRLPLGTVRQMVSEVSMLAIRLSDIMDIAMEIHHDNYLTVKEIKN